MKRGIHAPDAGRLRWQKSKSGLSVHLIAMLNDHPMRRTIVAKECGRLVFAVLEFCGNMFWSSSLASNGVEGFHSRAGGLDCGQYRAGGLEIAVPVRTVVRRPLSHHNFTRPKVHFHWELVGLCTSAASLGRERTFVPVTSRVILAAGGTNATSKHCKIEMGRCSD